MGYEFNLGQAFTRVAAARGDSPALRYVDGGVAYAALDERANRIAHALCGRGLQRRDVIGIVHSKSVDAYATMIAALKLGCAYVNLDDQNPPPRLTHILNTSRPTIVVGNAIPGSFSEPLRQAQVHALEFGDPDFQRAMNDASPAPPLAMADVTGADPAYIMYTSGSTGVPKGAIMTHANVLNFGAWIGSRFDVGPGEVLTNVNPMYFDNSVFDFYGALLNGATLAPFTRDTVANGGELISQVEARRCTLWFSVPSLLIYLMTLKLLTPDRLPNVRSFVFGGEGYPKPELRKLHDAYGRRSKLINVYGPTECTCMCSAWDVRPEDLEDESGLVTLGPIADNFSALVLDGETPVEPGGIGELCLLGPQVGLGYASDEERTRASFPANPLNRRWSERMYRTGDLVRLGSDGRMLDFVGRKDNQIKHMGYRIELEEIEAALNSVPGVVQCAVLQKKGRRDIKSIVAYVASEEPLTPDALRKEIERLLPPYMIPQHFDVRPELPKNPNGKIDRARLAAE